MGLPPIGHGRGLLHIGGWWRAGAVAAFCWSMRFIGGGRWCTESCTTRSLVLAAWRPSVLIVLCVGMGSDLCVAHWYRSDNCCIHNPSQNMYPHSAPLPFFPTGICGVVGFRHACQKQQQQRPQQQQQQQQEQQQQEIQPYTTTNTTLNNNKYNKQPQIQQPQPQQARGTCFTPM